MSTEPFIGEIKIFGFNFAPRGYATCQGQILSIAQNTALFSLLGTYYGGNGQTTFALPDLQGRAPVGQGQGPGLPSYQIGQKAGINSVTILTSNMPAHIHTLNSAKTNIAVNTAVADANTPEGGYLATNNSTALYSEGAETGKFLAPSAISGTTDITGGSLPIDITNPYLTINYSIALEGIFPSRN
ncbi:phage tail protein [Flavobacterium limi]|uniref:Microcystin dependent MdpB family protein n=1 Tax=Flavobacterium limi TaxID=2045105 RepID=A0ABQ1UYJ2_9FLAO|nr:tail fiber protein [Flavobacterium limi]GGF30446.1 microcystin dependent MdpB family protein [Flavobacterium limi]